MALKSKLLPKGPDFIEVLKKTLPIPEKCCGCGHLNDKKATSYEVIAKYKDETCVTYTFDSYEGEYYLVSVHYSGCNYGRSPV